MAPTGIAFLLESCSCLETLTVYVYLSSPEDIQGNEWEEEWNIDKCLHDSLIHNLQNVMVYGRVTDPYVIWLIEYLLGHACALEKIVISDKGGFPRTRGSRHTYYFHGKEVYTSNQLLEFSKKLLSFPRIYPRAVVLLE